MLQNKYSQNRIVRALYDLASAVERAATRAQDRLISRFDETAT